MSQLKDPAPVKPVVAVFSAKRNALADAGRMLEDKIGQIDFISQEFLFNQTSYYQDEMGGPLIKRFFAAKDLIDPGDLIDLKIWTVELEAKFSDHKNKRLVNVDPGYVSLERLVLATGKNNVHRIYLGHGVWADLTMIFERGEFKPLPWTFADYASDAVREVMKDIRRRYLDQLPAEAKERK
ncbi:MAG: DUF4416 family protein [Deltaproteobacteria bacterium]|nr:DUF4416 family protein [Deltaproteobacteria bacterium]MBW2050711.1 DUF4416 family protein [Deltaproteobacteria bacterium]MBW2322785.1 DUF4416 family protein [Deltaproteobacteria bacterium]